jgi:hypothetical protein
MVADKISRTRTQHVKELTMCWLTRLFRSKAARRTACAQRAAVADNRTRLVDAFIESYVSWREQCAEVQSAYDRWISGCDDGGLAFSIYNAELDLEEHAALACRDSTERLAVVSPPAAPSQPYRRRDTASSV